MVCKKIYELKKDGNERKHSFYKLSEKSLYTTSNKGFITRRHWNYILSKIDRELEKQKRKIVLLCDNLCSHIRAEVWDQYVKFRKNPGTNPCFVDQASYKNLLIIYLPPNSTATTQPIDQGYVAQIQVKFEKILNERLIHRIQFTRAEKVTTIAKLCEETPKKVVASCWNKITRIRALNQKSKTIEIDPSLESDDLKIVKENVEMFTESCPDEFDATSDMITSLEKLKM